MFIVSVSVHVKPDAIEAFAAVTKTHAATSRTEPGNLRFDVSAVEEDPTHFLLYEVYRSKDDFAAHQQTPHYQRWKATVEPWMARPRVGMKLRSIFPEDGGW